MEKVAKLHMPDQAYNWIVDADPSEHEVTN